MTKKALKKVTKKALNTKYGDIFVDWFNKHSDDAPEAFSASLDDFTSKLFEKAETTQADGEKVYIVNAGRMNHGKSSLFNSLLGKNELAVEDVRCTVENREVPWKDNFILMDTPGLDATDDDNTVAYDGYKKANIILFVHTVMVGELHESEIKAINKMKEIIGKEYFGKHFCLVLSFRDSVSPEALENIKNASVSTIKTACDTGDFPVFCISNRRYQKGIQENKMGLVALSGIPELIDYIEDKSEEWQSDKVELQEQQNEEILHQIILAMEAGAEKLKNSKNRGNKIDIKALRKFVSEKHQRIEILEDEINGNFKEFSRLIDEQMKITKKISENDWGFFEYVFGDAEEKAQARYDRIENELLPQNQREGERLEAEKSELWDEIQHKVVRAGILSEDEGVKMSELTRKLDEIEAEQKFAAVRKEQKIEYLKRAADGLKEASTAACTKPGINRQMVILTQYADSFDIDLDELKEAVQNQADDEARDILRKLREHMENISDECRSEWQELVSASEAAVEERYEVVNARMKEVHAIQNEWEESFDRGSALSDQIHALYEEDIKRLQDGTLTEEYKNKKSKETKRKVKAIEAKQEKISNEERPAIERRRDSKLAEVGEIFRKLGIWGEQELFVNAEGALIKNIESYQERLMEGNGLGSVYIQQQNSKKVLRAIDNMLALY